MATRRNDRPLEFTLIGSQGERLTEIAGHRGTSADQVIIDSVERPDLLLSQYFGHPSSAVRLKSGSEAYVGALHTRWQMGRRMWWLSQLRSTPKPAAAALSSAASERAALAATRVARALVATGVAGNSA